MRQLIADAARTALGEKARRAADPVAYLRNAASEVAQLVELLAPTGSDDDAAIRAIVAEEVELAAAALIHQLQN